MLTITMTSVDTIKKLKNYYQKQAKAPCLKICNSTSANQIVLIRHGEPDLKREGWYNRSMAKIHAMEYDKVGIKRFDSNPICLDSLSEVKVYHSALPRATHTAKLIFGNTFPMIADYRFREFEKKTLPFFNVHLPLKFWSTISRLLWYVGLNSRDIESVGDARTRAKSNARFLADEAHKNDIVVLVAHGFHNRYVSKYLKRAGWSLVRHGGIGYLSINILAR